MRIKKLLLSFLGVAFAVTNVFSQSGYTPADGSFTLAMGPNDDGSSSSISLPFTFCLYGSNYSSFYINNNGNVSFNTAYGAFSSSPFPVASYAMIAPFWADVDTRGVGTVKYKVTPTAIYINWDGVGYYSSQTDKVNSFQLIITNGTDPILPPGNNIAFYYGDMQWTTGAASSGVNGFGGTPATVGINKGDGMNYVQIGRFDQAGTAYDGGQGASDGVDWLDNKSFYFDGCTFPTAAIIGTTTVCNNTPATNVTFIGGGATAPYTFTYTINGGAQQTIVTTTGDSVSLAVPTGTAGSFVYALVSVQSAGSTTPSLTSGTATVTVNPCSNATATISGTATVCKDGTSPSITIMGSAGIAPYTFTYKINGGIAQSITTTGSDSTVTIAAPTNSAGVFVYSLVSVQDATATTPSAVQGNATITVSFPTATIAGTSAVCKGAATPLITFVGAGGIAPYTFTYTLNNGVNQTVVGTSDSAFVAVSTAVPGTYNYNLVSVKDASHDSCSQLQNGTATILVNPLPTATIAGTVAVCAGTVAPHVTLKGAGGTAPYSFVYSINEVTQPAIWSGSGDSIFISAPTNTVGTFIYSLVSVQDSSSTACMQAQSGTVTITVNPNPIAAFSSTSPCNGTSTVFSDSSSTSSGTITFWTWNLGDGSPLNTNQNLSYLYANGGLYSVKLRVSNSFGCLDSIVKSVKVNYNPIADFTHLDVCIGDSVHFINTSSIDSSTTISTYLWVFSDGSATSNLLNPVHYYSAPNTYNVTLIATSAQGCPSVKTGAVKVFAPPTSAFVAPNACLYDSTHLNNTSIQPSDGTIAAWSWDFGDGSAIDSIYYSSSHLYADTGEYTITLITHSSHLGCADTVEHTVVVYPKPTAGFNFINVCFHDTVHFLDSSFVSSDTIKHWSWDFGDGLPLDTLQNPDYLFGVYGIYGVKLIATTNHGCKDTAFHPVIIHPLPNVLYSSNNVCDGTTIEFASLSSVSLGDSINSYKWNFGDNTAQNNNQNASHLFDTSGSYPVTLVIVSSFGCVDSITKTSVVNPMPDVKFSVNDTIGCEPLCLSFQDVSLIATGVNAHWSWNFGDGSTLSTLQNPLHCYMSGLVNAPNIYDVTLTVTSDSGCTSSKTISNYITVYPKPHANFAPSLETSTIVNPFISFNNLSTGGDTWYWDFGDAASDTAQNPIFHEYRDTGIYVVTLIASNVYSCYDTAYKTIAIDPDFSFYIPNTFTPNGDGKNDVFEAKGVYVKDFEMSIFDRWGNLVFYSSDMTTSWDGKANLGKQTAQQDVYVYVVNLRDYKNQKHHYQGTVTVIR